MQIIKLLNEIKNGNLTYTSLSNKNKVRLMSIMESEIQNKDFFKSKAEIIKWFTERTEYKVNVNYTITPDLVVEFSEDVEIRGWDKEIIPFQIGKSKSIVLKFFTILNNNFNGKIDGIMFYGCYFQEKIVISNVREIYIFICKFANNYLDIQIGNNCESITLDNCFFSDLTISGNKIDTIKIFGSELTVNKIDVFIDVTTLSIRTITLPNHIFDAHGFQQLENLDLYNCELESVIGLENLDKLKKIELENNNLTQIKLPQNLQYIDISKNEFINLKSLRGFSGFSKVNDNPLQTLKGAKSIPIAELNIYFNQDKNIINLIKNTDLVSDFINQFKNEFKYEEDIELKSTSFFMDFFYVLLKIMEGSLLPTETFINDYIKKIKSASKKNPYFNKNITLKDWFSSGLNITTFIKQFKAYVYEEFSINM